jgi:hypothetical protein
MSYKVALVLTALTAVMLVGCHDPAGLPNNDVHIASTCTTYCYVSGCTHPTGNVSWWLNSQTPGGWYTRQYDTIKRRYDVQDDYVYPKTYGYCVFDVDFFSSAEIPVCTLFYRQYDHNGSLNLIFNALPDIFINWEPSAAMLWNAIDTSSRTLATGNAPGSDGWCWVAFSTAGSARLASFAAGGGGPLPTGWKFNYQSAGWWTRVLGVDDQEYAPYIKVVYYPDP